MPKHTVILGSYNRPRMVNQAIVSVLGQTVGDFQLIVADDGSNDETQAVIRRLIKNDSRCLLLTVGQQDDGQVRPDCLRRAVLRINDAVRIAQGEIIHYLADDDWYDSARFAIFDELFNNPEAVVGYGRLTYVDGAGKPDGRTRYPAEMRDPNGVLDQMQVAHRRLVFDKIAGWNPDAVPSDGCFLGNMSGFWKFNGVDRVVAYKRMHDWNMGQTMQQSTGRRE
jgi:glycosyltransferase involved in cell wall biosynthesis